MITLKNFSKYTPINNPMAGMALFLVSDDGYDWYESQHQFGLNTWKIEYESDGSIVAATKDVSGLAPIGHSVSEIEALPEGFSANGTWRFDGENVVQDVGKIAKREIQYRISEADKVIVVLSSERDAGIISDDDMNRWKAWIVYRKALRELEVTAEEIEWPVKPE